MFIVCNCVVTSAACSSIGNLMVPNDRLDEEKLLINALLCDVQTLHCDVFNQRSFRLTYRKVCDRINREGLSFLTKTLPRLGKALDRALTGEVPMNSTKYAFKSIPNSQLPMFMGELFQCIFSHNGWLLPTPSVHCIKTLRMILFYFYKYDKVKYSPKQEQKVIAQFLQTEADIQTYDQIFKEAANCFEADSCPSHCKNACPQNTDHNTCNSRQITKRLVSLGISNEGVRVIRRARKLLNQLFLHFDPMAIHPKHGPGAVSTKEKLWGKYFWRNIPQRIASVYPIDAYYYASFGHICDSIREINELGSEESNARVILVPKDSRGPRLISCEPLEFQWIQQGLGSAIVRHVEHHPLTRYNVHFTDQRPNQCGALLGSSTGRYATLDLKEASDRVTVGLVRLLFPSKVLPYLLACRSLGTTLPDGSILKLNKFAPMGSALCFPTLALTIWAILTSGQDYDADTREGILVYGDDVILPTAIAANSIKLLESCGLQVNRDKSCITGLFRESCGVDAYNGTDVTPLRLRKVWSSTPSPESFPSYVAHCNALWKRKYYHTYKHLSNKLFSVYGHMPQSDIHIGCNHSLPEVPTKWQLNRKRYNSNLQKLEWYTLDVQCKQLKKSINGWSMLLRYFAEASETCPLTDSLLVQRSKDQMVTWNRPQGFPPSYEGEQPFSVSSYTERSRMKIRRRWR